MSDGSTSQTIVSGNTVTFTGSSGISVVSATDTLTISLANDVSTNAYFDVLGHQHNVDGSNTYTEIEVKVITKTSGHIYHGTGSLNGYTLDGVEGLFLELKLVIHTDLIRQIVQMVVIHYYFTMILAKQHNFQLV